MHSESVEFSPTSNTSTHFAEHHIDNFEEVEEYIVEWFYSKEKNFFLNAIYNLPIITISMIIPSNPLSTKRKNN